MIIPVRIFLHRVLHVARRIVHPRQRHPIPRRIPRIPCRFRCHARRFPLRRIRIAQVQLIQIHIIKRIIEVLLRSAFQELRLHLHFRYLSDDDGARLIKVLIPDITVKHHFVFRHILSVQMPEDTDILRTILQWESDCQRITVRARKQRIF